MPKEYDAYLKSAKAWERAMRVCRTYEDKIDAMNNKMAKGLGPKEMEKHIALIKKLSKDMMSAGKKADACHMQMEKAMQALS